MSVLQVRGRPLGGTALPAIVDQYAVSNVDKLPPFTRRYVEVVGLKAGVGYQVSTTQRAPLASTISAFQVSVRVCNRRVRAPVPCIHACKRVPVCRCVCAPLQTRNLASSAPRSRGTSGTPTDQSWMSHGRKRAFLPPHAPARYAGHASRPFDLC